MITSYHKQAIQQSAATALYLTALLLISDSIWFIITENAAFITTLTPLIYNTTICFCITAGIGLHLNSLKESVQT